MSTFKLPDGTTVTPGNAFKATHLVPGLADAEGNPSAAVPTECLFPANWIQNATQAERDAIGLVEVADEALVDGRFYFAANSPRPLADVLAVLTSGVDAYVASTLAQTDWKITRAAEGYKAVAPALMTYRKALRDQGNALVVEITGLTFEQAIVWQPHDWPTQ